MKKTKSKSYKIDFSTSFMDFSIKYIFRKFKGFKDLKLYTGIEIILSNKIFNIDSYNIEKDELDRLGTEMLKKFFNTSIYFEKENIKSAVEVWKEDDEEMFSRNDFPIEEKKIWNSFDPLKSRTIYGLHKKDLNFMHSIYLNQLVHEINLNNIGLLYQTTEYNNLIYQMKFNEFNNQGTKKSLKKEKKFYKELDKEIESTVFNIIIRKAIKELISDIIIKGEKYNKKSIYQAIIKKVEENYISEKDTVKNKILKENDFYGNNTNELYKIGVYYCKILNNKKNSIIVHKEYNRIFSQLISELEIYFNI